jgi:hypothetical protein
MSESIIVAQVHGTQLTIAGNKMYSSHVSLYGLMLHGKLLRRIMTDQFALTTTVGGYSAGTRVDVLNFTKSKTVFVSIRATKEVLEIATDDVVKLRPRSRIVEVK